MSVPALYPCWRRCAATRPTTSRACPASARRRPPSSSTPTRDLDELFAHLDELTPKLRASLEADEAEVRQNFAADAARA